MSLSYNNSRSLELYSNYQAALPTTATGAVFGVSLDAVAKYVNQYCLTDITGRHRRWKRGARGTCHPKIWEKYFRGNYYVKFGHFSGKNRVKFGNFVNFRAIVIKIRVF